MKIRGAVQVVVIGAATLLAACSAEVSVGGKSIDAAELEEQVATQLQKQVGAEEPPTIECPNDLKAKVDAVTHCTLSTDDSEDEYDVRVTVTKVNEDTERAEFDSQVADEPNE